jgi:hypothetical protein
MTTKKFHIRPILSVTTGLLLTKPKAPDDNGIGDLYELLNFMTGDSLFTHQLPRASTECGPWLLRWFPELEAEGKRIKAFCETHRDDPDFSARLEAEIPDLSYFVTPIPADDHERINAYDELVQMRGTDEGVVILDPETLREPS